MASEEDKRSNIEVAIERLREEGMDEQLLTTLEQLVDRDEPFDIAQIESLILEMFTRKSKSS